MLLIKSLKNIDLSNSVFVVDSNVDNLYDLKFARRKIVLDVSEKRKNWGTVDFVVQRLLEMEIDKSTLLIGVGGGVTCDIVGFCATIYKRGIRFGFIPTTLVAQVDASLGGKNGVNFANYKNIIGTINEPDFVLIDVEYLNSLSKRELSCGFAEIVKTALVADDELFEYVEKNRREAFKTKKEIIENVVFRTADAKLAIVAEDLLDSGIRRILNFGHTVGHALERASEGTIPHGFAVAAGMIAELRLSVNRGYFSPALVDRVKSLMEKFELPTRIDYDADSLRISISADKKRLGGKIAVPLLKAIGNAEIELIDLDDFIKETL